MKGWVAVLSWFAVCVSIGTGAFWLATRPDEYNGVRLIFTISSDHFVSVKSDARAEFAASEFFVLRRGNDVIVGKSIPPPLGWKNKEYYTTDVDNFAGTWLVEKGDNITVGTQSEKASQVVVSPSSSRQGGLLIGSIVIGVFLFFGGWVVSAT